MLLQRFPIYLRTIHPRNTFSTSLRTLKTLSNNPHIYAIPQPNKPETHILTYLTTNPPTTSLSIGTTTELPPTPNSFTENPQFLPILNAVLAEHVFSDPAVQIQAQGFASSTASQILSTQRQRGGKRKQLPSVGGWLHVSDSRCPPNWARIADPEDIFGSVMVEGTGELVKTEGAWSESGTYRIVTNNGILGLSDYLREKLVERLQEEEKKIKAAGSS